MITMNSHTEKVFKIFAAPVHPADWDRILVETRNAQLATLSDVYESNIKHGYQCSCCEPIVDEPRQYFSIEEKLARKWRAKIGRPRLRG